MSPNEYAAGGGYIRIAEALDVEAVWALARDLATSVTPRRSSFGVAFAAGLADPTMLVAVAEQPERGVVGYVLAHVKTTFHANGPVAWVEEIMVKPELRGNGVGTAMMAYAEQWATHAGAVYVALASRRAGDFYRRLGYEDSAVFFKKGLADPIKPHPSVLKLD